MNKHLVRPTISNLVEILSVPNIRGDACVQTHTITHYVFSSFVQKAQNWLTVLIFHKNFKDFSVRTSLGWALGYQTTNFTRGVGLIKG
jgi:hypothetical protein